ncbi:MAG TPA: hypothetical protein VGU43_04905 [Thermoplasmata archaeon]|nr:hypothetical protein [Thermoplasmata archaeon]
MRIEGTLVRDPREHPLPASMRSRARVHRGRPRVHYRPVVRSPADVRALRHRGVPVFLVTDEWVSQSRYPVRFDPWLAVPESLTGSIESPYRILGIRDEDALRRPGLEELVTWLLRFDPLAARAVALRNRKAISGLELYRRIRNEGLEAPATRVRLQQLMPQIPKVGTSLPARDLAWADRNNPELRSAL